VGESGDRLTRAAKVLEQLTGGQTPVFSKGECASLIAHFSLRTCLWLCFLQQHASLSALLILL
jgi:ribosomal protein L5